MVPFMRCARYSNQKLRDRRHRGCYVSNAIYWYLPVLARSGSTQIYLKACLTKHIQLLIQHKQKKHLKKLPGFTEATTCSKNSTQSGQPPVASHCGVVGWGYCLSWQS